MLHIIKRHVIVVVVAASAAVEMGNAANAYARRNKFAIPSMRTPNFVRGPGPVAGPLTREKGFGGFRSKRTSIERIIRGHEKNHPPVSSHALDGTEGRTSGVASPARGILPGPGSKRGRDR